MIDNIESNVIKIKKKKQKKKLANEGSELTQHLSAKIAERAVIKDGCSDCGDGCLLSEAETRQGLLANVATSICRLASIA